MTSPPPSSIKIENQEMATDTNNQPRLTRARKAPADKRIEDALGVPASEICKYPVWCDLNELVTIAEHLEAHEEDPLAVLGSFLNHAVETRPINVHSAVRPQDVELATSVFIFGAQNPFEKKRARCDDVTADATPASSQLETGPPPKKQRPAEQPSAERPSPFSLLLEGDLNAALRVQDAHNEEFRMTEMKLREARENERVHRKDWLDAQQKLEEIEAQQEKLRAKMNRLDSTTKSLEGLVSEESTVLDQKLKEAVQLCRNDQVLCDDELRQGFSRLSTLQQVNGKRLEEQDNIQKLEKALKNVEEARAFLRHYCQQHKIMLHISKLGAEGLKKVLEQFPKLEDGLKAACNKVREGDASGGQNAV